MRLVYLNADPGIPLAGPKGASVHVRSLLHALAPRVESLACVPYRIAKRGAGATAAEEVASLPARVVAPGLEEATPSANGAAAGTSLAANDAFERTLDGLAGRGEMDVLLERYSLWSVAGARVARRRGVPWLLEVNAPLVEEAARWRSLALPSVARFLERELFRAADRLLVVSRELGEYVVAHGAVPGRVVVLPNGYDDEAFRPASRPVAEEDGPFTVAFAGSLKPWHGVETLVEAFLRLHAGDPDVRLRLVGDGPLADRLRSRLAASLPPDAWEMTGGLPHDRVPGALRDAHVAVAPYAADGPFYFSPLKVVEYAGLGLPIVASRLGQIAETLVDGESALLVPPGDAEALADALARLRRDPALGARLGAAARAAVRGRTWCAVADRLVAIAAEVRDARTPREVRA